MSENPSDSQAPESQPQETQPQETRSQETRSQETQPTNPQPERAPPPAAGFAPARPLSFTLIVPTVYGQMLVNRNDINQTNALFKTGQAIDHPEIELLATILSLAPPDPIVADVGANIGTYTLRLAAVAGPRGRVHCFEPQRILCNMIAGSTVLNGLTNVICHTMAVGAREGALEVPQFDYHRPLNFGSIEFGPEQREPLDQPRGHDPLLREFVPVTTLDRFGFTRLDLMKIDAEGMEDDVLTGATETIKRCRPVLYVEFQKSDYVALKTRLQGLGYTLYPVQMNFLGVPAELSQRFSVRGIAPVS